MKKDGTLVTDWSWTCPQGKCCWAKYHDFYQPREFNTYFYFDNIGKPASFLNASTLQNYIRENMQH
jgi:hypothetical protein